MEFLNQYSAAFEPKSVGTNHDYGSFVMRYNDFSAIKDKESATKSVQTNTCDLQALVKRLLWPLLNLWCLIWPPACCVVRLLSLNATYFTHASTSCSIKNLTHFQPIFLSLWHTSRLHACYMFKTNNDRYICLWVTWQRKQLSVKLSLSIVSVL